MFNSVYYNALMTQYLGENDVKSPSPRLWRHVLSPGSNSPDGSSAGKFLGDDFLSFGLSTAVSSNVARYAGQGGLYLSYEDTGNSIAQIATNHDGAIAITTDTTDNDESWLQAAGGLGVHALISDTAGSDKRMVFEARFKTSKVTDTYNAFVGLMEEGCAAADTVTDAGALADKDYIGFSITEADGDALKFVYKKAGQTAQTVLTYATALAADTYYKVGFVYDPTGEASKRIKVYIDNVEQTTYVTATNIAAATFPDGEELAFIAGIKNGSGAATVLTLDWWNFYQAK